MKPAPISRRLHLLLVPVALACALVAPAVASANKKLRVGFLDNAYALSNPDLFWSEARELNVGFMRWDLQWKHVAPTKPRNPRDPGDPAYHWGETDRVVHARRRRGPVRQHHVHAVGDAEVGLDDPAR